jgi:sigma-B regulation protein RsbU (phosphoserine phosphatase)
MSLAGSRVLIVDDHSDNRRLLAALLERMGITAIDHAATGSEGLAAIARRRPDLVLLDVMMPEMDGYEMCRRLRQTHPLDELPVLFVTALDSPKERTACFAAGGTDMVCKPINVPEVVSRVGVHLENRRLLDRLRAYQERVGQELAAARAIQEALTPSPEELTRLGLAAGIRIQAHAETSSELGGDFWSIRPLGDGRVAVLVADFAGHGVAAALNVIRLHTLFGRMPAQAEPHEMLAALNAELKVLLPPGQFATALYGIFDPVRGGFRFSSAAAPSPWLVAGGRADVIAAAGPLLGAFADARYETVEIAVPPRGAIVLHSDALTESRKDDRDIADENTVAGWLAQAAASGDIPRFVAARFHDLLPGTPPDDLTLIAIQRGE